MGDQKCDSCPCTDCTCKNCECKPGNAGCDPCADFQKMGKKQESIFTLVVTCKFIDEVVVDRFLDAFRPVAEYCDKSEPTTTTYNLIRYMTDPKVLRVVERYTNKSAYLDTHKSSKKFQSMRSTLQKMQDANEVEIQGESYSDTDVGYAVKESTPTVPGLDQVVTLMLDIDFKTTEGKDTAVGGLRSLSEYVRKNENNALTYKLLQSDKDPLRVLIWERYARDIDLTEEHNNSEPFKATGKVFSSVSEKDVAVGKYATTCLGYVKR
ncbi:hypothetical protein SARC_07476 [Sphaeroforma arctica JP610]|uniref:ABM domain-containing protein n=1 Tax=Sphaeroforma arctica JP610 TaxID=667725 RepID=A0A0L0FW51_9EUKA|nr:hypothetical protein SARC_07476 [Sphaeroforma arctica JP610]KNC80163.1 hypothetical protein SARC_07476 [Sphaeroforma arctica JP610]|eukprot:XP_014154065.1 hypothetical protein SARC_07476 [Sphaeroforma arctica JP610]